MLSKVHCLDTVQFLMHVISDVQRKVESKQTLDDNAMIEYDTKKECQEQHLEEQRRKEIKDNQKQSTGRTDKRV